jgi:single-strand DNA-binding protein
MKDVNKVVISGRLVRDPDLRYTGKGTPVAGVRVAVHREIKRGSGWEKKTVFVDVTIWGKRAERIAKQGTQGSQIFVDGHLDFDEWQDAKTGKKRSKVCIEADNAFIIVRMPDEGTDAQRPDVPGEVGGDGIPDDDIPF